jgi:hypothetical protein
MSSNRSGQTLPIVALVAALLLSACTASGRPGPAASPSLQPGAPPLRVVVLGDSDATAHGDSSGKGWARRYADLIGGKAVRLVTVSNLARDGQTSRTLLSMLSADGTLSATISEADIVLIGTGGADLNAGDELMATGACHAEQCFRGVLADFARNFDAAVAVIARLRGGKPTVLRAVTLPNAVPGATPALGAYQARTLREATCATMTRYGGQCIDVLTAFNGPTGIADAYKTGLMNHDDCCYPSGQGHQLIAELLDATGLSPLPLVSTSATTTP